MVCQYLFPSVRNLNPQVQYPHPQVHLLPCKGDGSLRFEGFKWNLLSCLYTRDSSKEWTQWRGSGEPGSSEVQTKACYQPRPRIEESETGNIYCHKQCCGSRSRSVWIRIIWLDPDLFQTIRIRIRVAQNDQNRILTKIP